MAGNRDQRNALVDNIHITKHGAGELTCALRDGAHVDAFVGFAVGAADNGNPDELITGAVIQALVVPVLNAIRAVPNARWNIVVNRVLVRVHIRGGRRRVAA